MKFLSSEADLDGAHGESYVPQTFAAIAARAFAAYVSFVRSSCAVVCFVVQQSGREVADAQIKLVGLTRGTTLDQTDEMGAQEPDPQLQISVLRQGVCDKRGLVSAVDAQGHITADVIGYVSFRVAANQAAKSLQPERLLDRSSVLRILTEVYRKFSTRNAFLKIGVVAVPQCAPC